MTSRDLQQPSNYFVYSTWQINEFLIKWVRFQVCYLLISPINSIYVTVKNSKRPSHYIYLFTFKYHENYFGYIFLFTFFWNKNYLFPIQNAVMNSVDDIPVAQIDLSVPLHIPGTCFIIFFFYKYWYLFYLCRHEVLAGN